MSASQEQELEQQLRQLSPEQLHKLASAELIERMKSDVFFSKLAEYNIVPRNADEAAELLTIGINIEKLSHHPAVKQAEQSAQGPSVLSFANSHLREKMAELGLAAPAPDADAFAVEKLSQIYGEDPAFQEAVLSVYGEE